MITFLQLLTTSGNNNESEENRSRYNNCSELSIIYRKGKMSIDFLYAAEWADGRTLT